MGQCIVNRDALKSRKEKNNQRRGKSEEQDEDRMRSDTQNGKHVTFMGSNAIILLKRSCQRQNFHIQSILLFCVFGSHMQHTRR